MNDENLIVTDAVEVPNEQETTQEEQGRVLDLKLTFLQEGIKIDLKSNLSALEQLGAIEIFKAHVLASALGEKK